MMNYSSAMRFACILITALVCVQGAAAFTFEQAPLNPAFVAYTGGTDAAAVACYSTADPSPGADTAPFATGLLPSPAVVYWPDGYMASVATDTAALPARFDLRDEGRVTPVRDQGKCGSCWAFATYGSLESTYLTETGEAEDFSENNVKNLCSDEYEDGFDYGPCGGGYAFMSDAYLVRGSGPVQEADDPYALPMPSNISPTDLSPVLDVREVTFLPQRTGPLDNDLFKEQLMQEGAIWVSFLVNWSCFADNYTTYYCPGEPYEINGGHAVTLVGWDDAFPKGAFAVEPPGDGAFILKNSWGTSVGEDGYFYISYYDPVICTFNKEGQVFVMDDRNRTTAGAVYTGVPAEEDRTIYQYDPLGWTTSAGTQGEGPLYGANVFTADGYEALTDVSFYTRGPETGYTVAIFTNFTTPPGDNTPVTWTSGTCTLPGYHTISLPEAVPLTPGEVFSVVLSIDNPGDTHPLVIETPIEDYSSQATAGPGESYVSENGGETWEDLNDIFPNTNLCIKAFTYPLTVVPRDYPTIQDAVNASVSGDTIIVEAGTYPEEISINRTLTLLGMDGVVVVTPADGTAIEIAAENVTIAGFMCDGGGSARFGIAVRWGDNCTISDCRVTGYENGLWLPSVQGLTLSDIACYGNDINFMYENTDADPGNTIAETVTVNGRPVIYREGVTGETIDASSNAGAVICVNCTDMTIRDTATGTAAYGYYLCGCEDTLLDTVTADDVEIGLGVLHSTNVTVQDSIFGPASMEGMLLSDNNGLFVDGNEIICNETGIFSIIIENFTISDNTITARDAGMGGWMCVNGSVTGNSINGNPDTGIHILLAQDMSLQNNTVDASFEGISALYFWDSLASGNTVRCNDTGVGFLILGDGSEISDNTVDNSIMAAIMELNNSSISKNRFSGGAYPVIEASDGEGAVFVYRNDFVLTDTPDDGGILSATAAHADTLVAPSADIAEIVHDCTFCTDITLPDAPSPTGTFHAMSVVGGTPFVAQQTDSVNVTWHSPTGESYWYGGKGFTRTMGNYWSTYTGTDATGDGIGDTPFVYLNETKDWYPLVQSIEWYLDEEPDTGGDNPSDDMATAGAMQAGDTATFSFTGTAVETVAITAADGTGRVVLTIDSTGSGPDGLTGQVYQYLTAELFGMTDGDVSGAAITFRVPAAWLKAEVLEAADMALWRFHDGAWQELPTSLVSVDGGWATYEAETPGFSTFAIAEGGKLTAITDAIPDMMGPGPEIGADTADSAGSPTTVPEPQVTVAIPEVENTGTPTETATTPQESPVGLLSLIGAGAALFFRRR